MTEYPRKQPRLDEWASGIAQEELEVLSGISAKQPYASNGPWVDLAALQLLFKAAPKGRLGRFELSGQDEPIARLAEAGLMTAKGKLTPEGEFLAGPARSAAAGVQISGSLGSLRTGLQLWIGDAGALVAAGPSYHVLLDAARRGEPVNSGVMQLDFVGHESIPTVVGQWLGLGPAWSIAGEPGTLPAAVLEARIADDTAPAPAEADARFLRMWHEPWAVYTMAISPGSFRAGMINAAASGFYRFGKVDGGVGLTPLPSGQLWSVLVNEIGGAATGRQR
jgi:hypothetical protein